MSTRTMHAWASCAQPCHERKLDRWCGYVLLGLLIFIIATAWLPRGWPQAVFAGSVCALTLLYCATLWRQRNRPQFTAILLVPLGSAIYGTLQRALETTAYPWATEVRILDWTIGALLSFLAAQWFAGEPSQARFRTVLVIFSAVLAAQATIQRYSAPGKIYWLFDSGFATGLMGPFVYANQYAAFVELMVPLALWGAIRDARRRWVHLAAVALLVGSAVAAASLAGTALILAELVVIPLLAMKRGFLNRRDAPRFALRTAFLVVLAAAVSGWGLLGRRALETERYWSRFVLAESTWRMAQDHMACGSGLGTWAAVYPAYATFDDGLYDNQAHNDWLQWLAEGGLPYFALMLSLPLLLWRRAMATVWGIGLIAVLLHCLVDYHFQQRVGFLWLYFTLATVVCVAPAPHAPPKDGSIGEAA